ncbi:MAG: hypothetical protein IKS94_08715 [Prevotella sp.]|nr:hypothetical protein [Prevotella sp.]
MKLKEWQKVLLGLLAIIVISFVVDRCVGFLFEKAYKNSKYGIFHRQEYCLHDSKDEILILGSSRAAHHYVPQIFTDSIGMSCYNCGSDGQCIYYQYGILSSYIERGDIPKVVLLEVMNTDAVISNGATFSLDAAVDRLAPNYGEYQEIDSLLLLKGWKERVKLFSKCYQYNSKAVQLIKCNFIPWPESKGYEAVFGELPDTTTLKAAKTKRDEVIDKQKLIYVNKLIRACKNNNIKLFFIESPNYSISTSSGIKTLKRIAVENSVPFFDYRNFPAFMHPAYFKDEGHLNDKGAHFYSSVVAGDLKSILKSNTILKTDI